MSADGTIVIDTKIDTSGFDKLDNSAKDIQKSVDKAADGIEDFQSELTKANVVSDLMTNALQTVVESLKEFVSGSIEAAAEVRAANAQFAQTFSEMEDEATQSLKSIADETGIAASRMQESYTSVFAFTKSVGADSEQALDIANRAMLAAADSAAYYDKSIEEATEALQSFLKGNYENDAALGIAATETTRNAKANELYATSFDKLSESQKVDVLLAMVEAGNKASGALGQAAREADSWANVTGEAKEAMRQLQAVIGDPILEAMIPIIQGITDSINDLIETTAADKLQKNIKGVTKNLENAEKQFDQTARGIEGNTALAKAYVKKLADLESAGLDTAESQREYANTVAALNSLMPELNLSIDEQTGLLSMSTDAILAEVEALKQKALYQAASEKYNAILSAQADAALTAADAERQLVELQAEEAVLKEELSKVSKNYNKGLEATNEAWLYGVDAAGDLTKAMGTMNKTTSKLGDREAQLRNEIEKNQIEQAKLNETLATANSTVEEQDRVLSDLSDTLNHVSRDTNEAAAANQNIDSAIDGVIENAKALSEKYEDAKTAAKDSIDSQIGYFDELKLSSDTSAQKIIENWESQKEAFDNYAANLEKAVDMGLDQTLVQQLSDGSKESMEILNALVNDTDTKVGEINSAFEKVSESRTTVATAMANITTDVNTELNNMVSDASALGPDVAKKLAEAIGANESAVLEAMRKLAEAAANQFNSTFNSKKVYVSNVPSNTVLMPYSDIPEVITPFSLRDTTTFEMPYLAKGAVIPPNAPFAAILGDQKSGVNVEAPLSTIQEALRLELSDIIPAMISGFESVLAEQRAIRETVSGIEIGDSVIGEAVERYNYNMSVVKGYRL